MRLNKILVTFVTSMLVTAVFAVATFSMLPNESAYSGTFPGENGQIAFTTVREGNSEVFVMNADGTEQTNLTDNPAEDGDTSWSPDGTKIAFATGRDFGNFENSDIYVMNADGTEQTRLTDTAFGNSPSWSPDGTKIAFTTRDGNFEVYVMNADGTEQTNISNNEASDGSPSWSPDGTKIAFMSNRDGNFEIYIMNSDGTEQTRLTNSEAATDSGPSWSPDGTKIAFSSNNEDEQIPNQIFVMNADGTEQTNISNNEFFDHSPDWGTHSEEKTPKEQVEDLIADVQGLDVPSNVKNALSGPLQAVEEILSSNEPVIEDACTTLSDFIDKVNDFEGNGKLTSEQADNLKEQAENIKDALEC